MKQKIKKFIQEIGILSISLTIAFVLVMGISIARGWVSPTASAPGGNVGTPINTSAITQNKAGTLGISGFLNVVGNITSKNKVIGEKELCIGSDCRSSWPSANASCVTATADALPNKGRACAVVNLLIDGKNICADNDGCIIRGGYRLDANNELLVVRDNNSSYLFYQNPNSNKWSIGEATANDKVNGNGNRKIISHFGNVDASVELFDDVPQGDFASVCNSNGTIENSKDAITLRVTNSDKWTAVICD